jgi:hypothetical protein
LTAFLGLDKTGGMNPTDLLIEIYGDDSNVEDVYPLDAISDGFVPPGKAGELTRQNINQRQCERVRVVKLVTGEFFLRWDERHPEMISQYEYCGLREVDAGQAKYQGEEFYQAKRNEHAQLYGVLPSRRYGKPLTREQAFALVVALSAPEEFAPEIDALWPSA